MLKRIHLIHILMFLTLLLSACIPSVSAISEPTAVAVSTVPANSASISGAIWHDLCALAGGEGDAPLQPSAGCVPSDDGGFEANGVREAGEPGLADVLVSLGFGACDAITNRIEVRTNQEGDYEFASLPAGPYCVMIDPLRAENAPLLPGGWTAPAVPAGASAAAIPVNLAGSEQKAGIDFGWDYQFLPVPPEAQSDQPIAAGQVNVQALNLRAGPGLNHRIFLELAGGTALEIMGRSENLEWLLVRLQSGTQGWVYYQYVDTQVAIADLPLREAYGGAYLNPADDQPVVVPQEPRQPQNILVSIQNNQATVHITGFRSEARLVLTLERPDGKASLVVGKGETNANGNAVIHFEMPREWPDGKPLGSGDLDLVVSSKDGQASISASIQYYR